MARDAPQPSRSDVLRVDLALAVALLAGESLLWILAPREYWPPAWGPSLAWMALGYAALALRRTAPWVAVGLLAVHLLLSSLAIPMQLNSGIPLVIVTYTVASSTALRRAVFAAAVLWIPPMAIVVLAGRTGDLPLPLPPAYFIVYNLMGALVCFFVGRTVFNRRAYVAALEDRARTAEGNQRAVAEQAVAEERRRIARELHDVVAHHVSVMSVLATGTRRALQRDPAAADQALITIEQTGRVALREMRRMLEVLRTDAEPAGELAPQPGLPGLEPLLDQVREAGLPVSLSVAGDTGELDEGVALAVYRITQESLTNTLKHAGRGPGDLRAEVRAEVRLDVTPARLTIEISDTGRGPQPGAEHLGHGVLGMRERVSLYGGTLRTGPRPGGGFRVVAEIPLDPDPVQTSGGSGSAGISAVPAQPAEVRLHQVQEGPVG